MKVLVTGANGLVGQQLLGLDWEFYAATRTPPTAKHLHWLPVDLAQPVDTQSFPHQLDAIVYLAQSNRYRDLPAGADDLMAVNVNGAVRMLQYAATLAPKPHFILASTGDVYGRSLGKPLQETDLPFQNIAGTPGLYPLSRKLAEDFATSFASHYGLKLSIIRLFHIYGAGMPPTALVARLWQSVLAGQPIRLEGEHGLFIHPTHVSDVVEALRRLVEQTGAGRGAIEVYNIATQQPYRLKQMAEIIGEKLGKAPEFSYAEATQGLYITPSTAKFSQHYGSFETLDFPSGLALSKLDG